MKVCSEMENSTLLPSLEWDLYPGAQFWEVQPKFKSLLDSGHFHVVAQPEKVFVFKTCTLGAPAKLK